MRRVVLFAALAFAAALFAAPAPQARAADPVKVTVAEATRGEGWLPVYLAKELGYFKDQGLDVEFVTYKDGPLAQMGLINGDAQFCIIGSEPVLMAYEKGQETKLILTTLVSQPYMFVARPGLTKAEDFKGKTVFGGMPGSAPYFFVKKVIRNAGLDPDKDVTFASLEYGAEIPAMAKGDLDGAYVRATRVPQVEAAGEVILVNATDPEQHKKVYGSPFYEAMDVQTTNEYIKEHPEVVQAFANAVSQAMAWQAAHSDEEVAKAVSPLFPGRNIDAALVASLRPCLSADGIFSEEGYNSVIDFCVQNGVIKKPIPMSGLVDNSFMEKAKANRK